MAKPPAAGIDALEAFRGLSALGRALLGPGLRELRFARPGLVLRRGEPVSGAYVVLEGRLRVYAVSRAGVEATLYSLAPGETCVLALNCVFNDLLYPAWVQAEAGARVAVIPGSVYRLLFEREATIRNLTVQALSGAVFRLMEELEALHACTLEQRLAAFLLRRATSSGVLRMTQQEIASQLGTTREVVARALRALAVAGAVRTQRGAVTVLRATALSRAAGAATSSPTRSSS